jgi:hypothetical protein
MFRIDSDEKAELVTICHRFESMKHSSALPYVPVSTAQVGCLSLKNVTEIWGKID